MWSKVWLRDPDGQVRERSVRVTQEAVEEWLDDRDVLRAMGRPDRPPDVDLPTMREWVEHPGEESLPYFVERRSRQWFRLYMVRWPNRGIRFEVRGWPDGSLMFSVMAESREGPGTMQVIDEYILPPEAPHAYVGDLMVGLMEAVDRAWLLDPEVTSYEDFRLLEEEMLLAQADVARGFHDPLPEGRA